MKEFLVKDYHQDFIKYCDTNISNLNTSIHKCFKEVTDIIIMLENKYYNYLIKYRGRGEVIAKLTNVLAHPTNNTLQFTTNSATNMTIGSGGLTVNSMSVDNNLTFATKFSIRE